MTPFNGGAGDDTVEGASGAGADSIMGGTGDDILRAGDDGANDTIVGGDGDDCVDGGGSTLGGESLEGDNGADTITSSAFGNDTLSGGAGDDSLNNGDSGIGNNSLSGGDGNDTLLGSAGDDTVDTGAGADSVDAGDGDDSILGASTGATIDGGAGDDTIVGGGGIDETYLTTGAALVNGLAARRVRESAAAGLLLYQPGLSGSHLGVRAGGLNFSGHTETQISISTQGTVNFGNGSVIEAYGNYLYTEGGVVGASPGGNSTGSDKVWYDLDPANHTVTITCDDVGAYNYYGGGYSPYNQNAFQLQLIGDGSGSGAFDVVFREKIVEEPLPQLWQLL